MQRTTRVALTLSAIAALAGAAQAATNREAKLFDPPTATKTLAPKSADDPLGQITCTYSAGLMVWESGTDSPDPGDAKLAPFTGAKRPACAHAAPTGAVAVKTEGFFLLGRKGPFLVFEASDPNGAVDFMVLAASDGHTVFTDAESDRVGMRSVTLTNGVLRLTYTRGLNASCSVPQDGAACWTKLAKAGDIPAAVAKTPPPVAACKAAYRKGPHPTPADDPSIILYPVQTTIDAAGKADIVVRGALTCEPMP